MHLLQLLSSCDKTRKLGGEDKEEVATSAKSFPYVASTAGFTAQQFSNLKSRQQSPVLSAQCVSASLLTGCTSSQLGQSSVQIFALQDLNLQRCFLFNRWKSESEIL